MEKVRRNKAVLLFLGDAVHNDRSGFTFAMDSSIEIMDIIVGLITEFPANVIYLLGNHDSFAPELSKLGIQQGLLYREALLKARGKQYVALMQEFFDALPLFVIHRQLPRRARRAGARRHHAHRARERAPFRELHVAAHVEQAQRDAVHPEHEGIRPRGSRGDAPAPRLPARHPDLRRAQPHVEMGRTGFDLDRCPGVPRPRHSLCHAGDEVPVHLGAGLFTRTR